MRMLINIDVPELKPAIDFYRAALGLGVGRVFDDDFVELTGASSAIYLLRKAAGSSPAKDAFSVRAYSRHWMPVHFDLVVDDVEAAAKRAVAAGAQRESGCVEWMGSKCISLSDPFGHGFCFIEFTGETYSEAA